MSRRRALSEECVKRFVEVFRQKKQSYDSMTDELIKSSTNIKKKKRRKINATMAQDKVDDDNNRGAFEGRCLYIYSFMLYGNVLYPSYPGRRRQVGWQMKTT